MSAGKIQSLLSNESKRLWAYRAIKEKVLLMDWDSNRNNLKEPIVTLKRILLDWDLDVQYKNPLSILDGGYAEFMDYYPTLTTKCVDRRPSQPTQIVNLEDIEYSSIHEVPMKDARIFHQPNDVPKIDRSSKAAADKLYSENLQRKRETLLDQALQNEQIILDKLTELNDENIHKYDGDEAKLEEARLSINNERMELEDKQAELLQMKLKYDRLQQQLQEERAKNEQYRMDVDSTMNAEIEKRIAEKERQEDELREKRKQAELVEKRQRESEVRIHCLTVC